ncbi:LLM class flavin-dependent oxidoreductase [Luteimicrobium sp. DT211]|uniref:LLM class flavin-dependent oxidoreductase n=1 Tax=Luteimicrobium sp. DT211 TaxID=3393412 RepID=UPI003CE876A2
MTTLGAVFPPTCPPELLVPAARAAEEAGVDELWLWEDCFKESGVAAAAIALTATTRLRVGVGVMPVPLRNVALTAMEVATLERAFPGRFVPGIGHGVQDWMGQVGNRAESPLTLLREYATALRALLAGERVTTEGRYVRLHDVALDWPPAAAPLVLSAATGPRTVRLTGEVADGTILEAISTPDDVRTARAVVDEARVASGRADGHVVVVNLATTGDARADADAVRARADAGADTVVLQPAEEDAAFDAEAFVRYVGTQVRPLL